MDPIPHRLQPVGYSSMNGAASNDRPAPREGANLADNRDDFSSDTINRLAKRAGYICAYPDCHQLTVGPSDDRRSGVTMVGVAAHITAAAKNGPRYDATLTPDVRASEDNGVWMCQTHGKAVDDTASRHTVAQLIRRPTKARTIGQRRSYARARLRRSYRSDPIAQLSPLR